MAGNTAVVPTPPPKKIKLALCQILAGSDKARNIEEARKVFGRRSAILVGRRPEFQWRIEPTPRALQQDNACPAMQALNEAADKGASLLVLPEIWNSPYANSAFPVYAEEIDPATNFAASPSAAMMAEVARSRGVTIVGGSIPERSQGRLYNTCCVFGRDGRLLGRYRKTHLFGETGACAVAILPRIRGPRKAGLSTAADIDIPGKITFRESDTLTKGEGLLVVDSDGVRIGWVEDAPAP